MAQAVLRPPRRQWHPWRVVVGRELLLEQSMVHPLGRHPVQVGRGQPLEQGVQAQAQAQAQQAQGLVSQQGWVATGHPLPSRTRTSCGSCGHGGGTP